MKRSALVAALTLLSAAPARAEGVPGLWSEATGGRLTVQGRVARFTDRDGMLVGVSRFDARGRIVGPPRKALTPRLARELTRQEPLDACLSREISPDEALSRLLRDLERAGVRRVRCADGDGAEREYNRFELGVWMQPECAGEGSTEALESELRGTLRKTLSCLMEQKPLGPSLAQSLAAVLLAGNLSPRQPGRECEGPRALRVRCAPSHGGGFKGSSSGDRDDPDFPAMTLEGAVPAAVRRVLPHELMHLIGFDHGIDIDHGYAITSCCFPESAEGGDPDGRARAAACAILRGDAGSDPVAPAYLQSLRRIYAAQGRPGAFLGYALVGLAATVPRSERAAKWPGAVQVLVEQLWEAGDYSLARALAAAELALLPASSPAKTGLASWVSRIPTQEGRKRPAVDEEKLVRGILLARASDYAGLQRLMRGWFLSTHTRDSVSHLHFMMGLLAQEGEELERKLGVADR